MKPKGPSAKKKPARKKATTYLTVDNTNMLEWLFYCFIICGCMFFLGVLVGKNTAPVQFDVDRLEEKLADLQASVLKEKDTKKAEDLKPEVSPHPTINGRPELTVVEEDIIDQLKDKGKEPVIYKQYVPPVLTPKYAKTPPAKQKPKYTKKLHESEKQVKQSATETKPASLTIRKPEVRPDTAPAPEPVVTPKTNIAEKTNPKVSNTAASGQKFAVQVASLKDPEKAKIVMRKFKNKGYPAYCRSSKVDGTTWHRVRIGPYPDRATADKDRDRLKAAGVNCLIVSTD